MSLENSVRDILAGIGEDPDREGLLETPKRVIKALREMTEGYQEKPAEILSTTFAGENYDQMVVVSNIEFNSLCEHHMLPFIGKCHVGYLPSERVVGLSKIPRLVHCFAKRLQIQERMTTQIATSINDFLNPHGVGVIVEAKHLCASCRGVKQKNSLMTTSSLLGNFREHEVRAEFMFLVK